MFRRKEGEDTWTIEELRRWPKRSHGRCLWFNSQPGQGRYFKRFDRHAAAGNGDVVSAEEFAANQARRRVERKTLYAKNRIHSGARK